MLDDERDYEEEAAVRTAWEQEYREEVDAEQEDARVAVDTTSCPTCGRAPGQLCIGGADPWFGEVQELPHAARYHAGLLNCGRSCPDCWSYVDLEGVTVRASGADETLIVLWRSG